MSKKNRREEFVSNVTGEAWTKHISSRWHKVINQVGVIISDEVHKGKKGTTVTLEAGSRVIVDDIRGRILPQYRVKDTTGKIWFVSELNVEFPEQADIEDPTAEHEYRGGVRVDGSDAASVAERYDKPLETTEEVLRRDKKEKKTNG